LVEILKKLLTCHVIAIGSGTGTTAENVRGKVVDFFTVFVSDNRATSGTSVSSESYSILIKHFWLMRNQTYLVNQATNGGSSFHVLNVGLKTDSCVVKESFVAETVVVVEVCLRHAFDVAKFLHFDISRRRLLLINNLLEHDTYLLIRCFEPAP
jgi:hypothetical protein